MTYLFEEFLIAKINFKIYITKSKETDTVLLFFFLVNKMKRMCADIDRSNN